MQHKVFRLVTSLVLTLAITFAGFTPAVAVSLPKVAVYAADLIDRTNEVVTKLATTGLYSQVDNLSPVGCGSDPTPTLATLQLYTAVMVWSDCSINDPTALGDVLADYIDGGGHVVVSTFAISNFGNLSISGRFATGGYLPLTLGSTSATPQLFLVADLPSDPLLAGVSSFDGGSDSHHNSPVSLVAGATLVAHWTDGQPLVAYKGNVVALNFYPPSSDSLGGFWNSATDGVRLMTNALNPLINIIVNSTTDAVDANPGDGVCDTGTGECTLRAAIQEANALPSNDTITLPAGIYTLAITGANEDASATGDLDITSNLTISGVGSAIIDGNGNTLNDRVFHITGAFNVNIAGVTIRGGNVGFSEGGGIFIAGGASLILTVSTVSDNVTSGNGGGIRTDSGATTTLNNSTISNNSADGGCGGGIFSAGILTLNNSSISGNTALCGGGIYNFPSFTATLYNTIVANSPSGGNCDGAITDGGGNLSWPDATCPGINADPILGPLSNNGGSTETHALLTGSAAIDAAIDSNCPLTDQRGIARPQGTHCDIGAFELEQVVPPLVNDDFDNAILIEALPYSDNRDTSTATSASDDPTSCYNNGSVWYQFTPPVDTTITAIANTFGSNYDTTLGVFTGSRGALELIPGGCNDDFASLQSRVVFNATGGTTYYFMLGFCCGNGGTGGGNLVFSVDEIPAPPNDNFADATEVTSLSSPIDFDTLGATFESNEPPTCGYPSPPYKTVWYSFTASQTGHLSASVPSSNFTPFVAVYSGTDINNLTQLRCGQGSNRATFQAVSSQTYYFQVGGFYGEGGTGQFLLENAPLPQASFYYYPGDPSKYDTIQFQDNSSDPGNLGIQTYAWNFGDGTSASSPSSTHKYAADGDYQVTHTVTTIDGRTGSSIQTVQVRTHDVAITKIAVPASANVGQTKTITVTLRNIAYPETVQIDLYKSTPNGFEYVATVTKSVAALSGNRTTSVNFSYKFTSDDARLGKVTFKAIVTIIGARDSYPADNEKISTITKVAR